MVILEREPMAALTLLTGVDRHLVLNYLQVEQGSQRTWRRILPFPQVILLIKG